MFTCKVVRTKRVHVHVLSVLQCANAFFKTDFRLLSSPYLQNNEQYEVLCIIQWTPNRGTLSYLTKLARSNWLLLLVAFLTFPILCRFPKDEELRKQWEAAVGRKGFSASRSSSLCSEHFGPEHFDRTGQTVRIRAGVVPSVFRYPGPDRPKVGVSPCCKDVFFFLYYTVR